MVENAGKFLVQDHLGEGLLHDLLVKADEGRDVGDLHAGEGLNDAAQVLLQQSRVEVVKVRRDDRVLCVCMSGRTSE